MAMISEDMECGRRKTKLRPIDRIIAEVTGVHTYAASAETVWVYGEVLWGEARSFDFEAEPPERSSKFKVQGSTGLRPKRVTILTPSGRSAMITRYRDGSLPMFLIEMPRTMSQVLGLEEYVLSPEELERKKQRIDTTVPY
jgi:hypothetical protein